MLFVMTIILICLSTYLIWVLSKKELEIKRLELEVVQMRQERDIAISRLKGNAPTKYHSPDDKEGTGCLPISEE